MAVLNAYCKENRLPASMHLAESLAEAGLILRGDGPFAEMFATRGITWSAPNVTPTAYASRLGALRADVAAVHCVHQSADDIALLAETGAAIVHCPKSNAKLGVGVAPMADWLRVPGLRVGLGTDSAVSNNCLDMFEEMRFALLMQRAVSRDVQAVDAPRIVRMATLGGAEALALDGQTGSLTPGKKADLIAVRTNSPHVAPVTDPYAGLVYAARADDVVFTMCDGVALYDSGRWLTMSRTAVMHNALQARAKAASGREPTIKKGSPT
jgi:5-methylthioadenosine/S-adenosylhomocysteine deaminase